MIFKIYRHYWFGALLLCVGGEFVQCAQCINKSEALLSGSVSEIRRCILSLWEIFDLLQACRIAPEARADFEAECPSLAYTLLKCLSAMVMSCDLEDTSGEICVLRRYFVAMHESFMGACRNTYVGVEKQLCYLLESLDRLFLVLCERYGIQNEVEIAIPTRLLAFAAALQPSA